jgi:hypothetical protein
VTVCAAAACRLKKTALLEQTEAGRATVQVFPISEPFPAKEG